MSKGDFYENEFVTLEQYKELIDNYNFNLFSNMFPRDIEALKLEKHVRYIKDNTDLFEELDEEEYYSKIEQMLGESYTRILISESPYNSSILKKANIKGDNFVRFLKVSSGSESSIFYPYIDEDGNKSPVYRRKLLGIYREDFKQVVYGIGYTEFIGEFLNESNFIIFKEDNIFI